MSNPSDESSAMPAKRTTTKRAKKAAPADSPPGAPPETLPAEIHNVTEPAKKRPKRRRGKKGKGPAEAAAKPPQAQPPGEIDAPTQPSETDAENIAGPEQPSLGTPVAKPHSQARPPRHDGEDLAKKAWKIYLAEVSEEGVALLGDHDARELSRRCFRLAELFLDEQARHSPSR